MRCGCVWRTDLSLSILLWLRPPRGAVLFSPFTPPSLPFVSPKIRPRAVPAGANIDVSQRKARSRLQLTSGRMVVAVGTVPPPKGWNVEESMAEKLTRINVKIERIQLRYGLGAIAKRGGRSARCCKSRLISLLVLFGFVSLSPAPHISFSFPSVPRR